MIQFKCTPEKKSGLNGDCTQDGAMLYHLSYEAIHAVSWLVSKFYLPGLCEESTDEHDEHVYIRLADVSTADFLGKLLELSASLVWFYMHSATMTLRRQFSKVERIYLVLYHTWLKFFSRRFGQFICSAASLL